MLCCNDLISPLLLFLLNQPANLKHNNHRIIITNKSVEIGLINLFKVKIIKVFQNKFKNESKLLYKKSQSERYK